MDFCRSRNGTFYFFERGLIEWQLGTSDEVIPKGVQHHCTEEGKKAPAWINRAGRAECRECKAEVPEKVVTVTFLQQQKIPLQEDVEAMYPLGGTQQQMMMSWPAATRTASPRRPQTATEAKLRAEENMRWRMLELEERKIRKLFLGQEQFHLELPDDK